MTKKLDAAALEQRLREVDAEIARSASEVVRLESEHGAAIAEGADALTVRRKAAAIAKARDTLSADRESRERTAALLDEARAREAAARADEAWAAFDVATWAWIEEMEGLQAEIERLGERFRAALKLGDQTRALRPERLRGAESGGLAWVPDRLTAYVEQQLFASTDGVLGKGHGNTPWEIRQRQNLPKRAQETRALAMRDRPQRAPSESPDPEAA